LTQQINSIVADVRAIGKLTEKSIKIIAGESIASDPLLPGLTKQQCTVHVGDASFLVNGGSFFQSNCFITEKMGTWASPMANGKLCVDLYGGTGFFSVMLGKQFSKGIMIESIQSQVEIAKYNFEKNGVSHFKALCSNAEQFESSIPFAPDLLIVDPPRPGLDKRVRKSIISVKPSKL
jgi:23S rRNA (uracil1939-C5)-methyltransferase